MMSRGGARYQSRRCLVTAASASATTWRLNGLALATSTDLLKRSNGSTHQRRQTSAGEMRGRPTSPAYLSGGEGAGRALFADGLWGLFQGGEGPWVQKGGERVARGGG